MSRAASAGRSTGVTTSPPTAPAPTRSSRLRLAVAALLIVSGVVLAVVNGGQRAAAQDADGAVVVVDISGEIDLGLAPYLERVLDAAAEDGAAAIVVEIDTPGGRLDAVLQMRDALLASPVPTIAFVNRTAFSAGALVALASEEIWMTPGATMGAATPVEGATGATASEKVISAVRSTFRATAEERDRDPTVGAAMVDPAIAIDELVAEGELLTLTTSEAVEVGYADGVAASRGELLDELGLADATVREESTSPAEALVRIVTSPVLASALISIGVLLIVGDVLIGGVGVGTAIGAGLLGVFAYGHLLAGLAGWEDLALIALGIALLFVEVFVLPGFGIAGVLGLAGVLGGGVLAMLGRDFDFVGGQEVTAAVATMVTTFVVAVLVLGIVLAVLARRRGRSSPAGERGWLRWLGDGGVLERDVDPGGAPAEPVDTPAPRIAAPGDTGTALTDLRPAGVADFDGHRVDVVSEGGYLEAGEELEVVRAETYRRIVRRRRT